MNWRSSFAVLAAAVLLCSCSGEADQPQEGLPRTQITIDGARGPLTFDVDLATTDASRTKGLMFRRHLNKHEGMLFEFDREDFRAFWMKNTMIPLDIIFVRADGTISNIAEETIPYSETPVPSSEPAKAVLEIAGGEARAQGVAPGQKIHAKFFKNER